MKEEGNGRSCGKEDKSKCLVGFFDCAQAKRRREIVWFLFVRPRNAFPYSMELNAREHTLKAALFH